MLQIWITGVVGVAIVIVAYMSLDISVLQWVLTIAGLVLVANSIWLASEKNDNYMRRMSKRTSQ